jgi:4-carboxymuconolactone decarboxylase
MARVSLIEEKDHPELADLIATIRSARRGDLLNLYRLLLHSPALAQSWMEFNNAVRWQSQLDGRLREIAIIRIGHLCRADYIVQQHVPRLALPEGLTLAECDALRDWRASGLFSERERAVLAYTDAVTRDLAVPDAVFAALRSHFDERQVVELTVLIGMYNMHGRVFTALQIDPEPSQA